MSSVEVPSSFAQAQAKAKHWEWREEAVRGLEQVVGLLIIDMVCFLAISSVEDLKGADGSFEGLKEWTDQLPFMSEERKKAVLFGQIQSAGKAPWMLALQDSPMKLDYGGSLGSESYRLFHGLALSLPETPSGRAPSATVRPLGTHCLDRYRDPGDSL